MEGTIADGLNQIRTQLDELWDYELWSNRKWLPHLARFQDEARAESVFRHILRAQETWLRRAWSEEDSGEWPTELEAAIEFGASQWRTFIRMCDPEAFVSYTNQAGDPFFQTVEQITRHVLNHGTYHRGHLRGLAMAEGWDDFDDTDLIRYYREKASCPS